MFLCTEHEHESYDVGLVNRRVAFEKDYDANLMLERAMYLAYNHYSQVLADTWGFVPTKTIVIKGATFNEVYQNAFETQWTECGKKETIIRPNELDLLKDVVGWPVLAAREQRNIVT